MELKEQILQAGTRQLVEAGYSGLNFGDIASEVGTTRANIHHHFSNKETLAREALESYVQHMVDDMQGVIASTDGDVVEVFAAMEEILWKRFEEHDMKGACVCAPLLVNTDAVPQNLRDLAAGYFNAQAERIAQVIKTAQARGTIASERDASEVAREGMVLILGVIQMTRSPLVQPGAGNSLRGVITNWAKSL